MDLTFIFFFKFYRWRIFIYLWINIYYWWSFRGYFILIFNNVFTFNSSFFLIYYPFLWILYISLPSSFIISSLTSIWFWTVKFRRKSYLIISWWRRNWRVNPNIRNLIPGQSWTTYIRKYIIFITLFFSTKVSTH